MSDDVSPEREAHRLYDTDGEPTSDRPWIIRTYAGHSSPKASNELYRRMCARLSVGKSLDEPESVDEVLKALA